MIRNLLTALLILTASISYSQGITPVTDQQKKEAIKNAQKVEVLGSKLQAQGRIVMEQDRLIEDQNKKITAQSLAIQLWEKNYKLLQTQYEAEKAKKPKDKTFIWILRCIGVAAVGFVVGSLAN